MQLQAAGAIVSSVKFHSYSTIPSITVFNWAGKTTLLKSLLPQTENMTARDFCLTDIWRQTHKPRTMTRKSVCSVVKTEELKTQFITFNILCCVYV